MNRKQKKTLIRIIISAALLVSLPFIKTEPLPGFFCYAAAYLIIGYDILLKTGKGLLNRRIFDETFLMTVATIGAFALAIWGKSGNYGEAVAVMLFYQIGEFFQSLAVRKSRKNISELMDIRPDYANIEIDGRLEKANPKEIGVGTVIVVCPGEKVPLDGIVLSGFSSLNTSALTGESLPKDVKSGDEIISGCINMTGLLKVRTTKVFGESTVSKILELVESSAMRKAKTETLISKFARIYTPAVCADALFLFLLPALFTLAASGGAFSDWNIWLYRALTFLVVSCPCALVISIPLAFFAGIGGASRKGILIKGSVFLESLSKTKYVAFDKTGTLTKGVFEVSGIFADGITENELLRYAALAESSSNHPIAKSLLKAYGRVPERNAVNNIQEMAGYGVKADIDGINVAAGNEKLMISLGITPPEINISGSVVHAAVGGRYAGYILVSDMEKPTSAKAVKELKSYGIAKTIMLTGDRESAAAFVAESLGIDEYKSGLLPSDKVNFIEKIMNLKSPKEMLAFVGDGINDAPVLTRADVGIAMGALGSDAAIEAADVVLMDDDPLSVVQAIKISKKTIRIVYQNIIFSLAVKFACLILSAFGIADMWAAIFADVGVMIIAVLNSIRALRF